MSAQRPVQPPILEPDLLRVLGHELRSPLASLLGYAELRMSVTRGAVVRHLMGAHSWDVTARSVTVPSPRTEQAPSEREPDLEAAL